MVPSRHEPIHCLPPVLFTTPRTLRRIRHRKTEEWPVPTSKQRRENARRRLERQIQRRQEAASRRRRRNVVLAAALSVLVVVGGVWLLLVKVGGNDNAAAAPSASATPTATPSAAATPAHPPRTSSGPCKYTETTQTLTNPNAKDVGLPDDPKPTPAKGTVPVTVKTNQGTMVFTLDRAKAPCAVQSFLFLAGKKFFDNTPCPRVSSKAKDGLGILQCGDPTGTGQGGPTYQFKEENLKTADYSVGVLAMANGGAGTTGSQFFIIHEDAKGLGKNYSVIGKVTTGLDIVQKVAKAGNDGSNQAGGGKPKLPITIESVQLPA
jgi:peptidyl-prolyl cis-trans isomerase B (cyclophilin B)